MEWRHEGYVLTDDPGRADLDAVHALLRDTYWAAERSRTQVALTLASSLVFSLLHDGTQVGLARVLTDRGATSYLCDVVVDEAHRARGVGAWMVETVLAHPDVRDTRVLLITRDAQEFYRRLGFETHPFECMLRARAPGGRRADDAVPQIARKPGSGGGIEGS
jgi:ribosomal protein S18 acetylase RimI-like enzyme